MAKQKCDDNRVIDLEHLRPACGHSSAVQGLDDSKCRRETRTLAFDIAQNEGMSKVQVCIRRASEILGVSEAQGIKNVPRIQPDERLFGLTFPR